MGNWCIKSSARPHTLTIGPLTVYLSQGSPRSTPCLGWSGVHQPPQWPGSKPPPQTGCAPWDLTARPQPPQPSSHQAPSEVKVVVTVAGQEWHLLLKRYWSELSSMAKLAFVPGDACWVSATIYFGSPYAHNHLTTLYRCIWVKRFMTAHSWFLSYPDRALFGLAGPMVCNDVAYRSSRHILPTLVIRKMQNPSAHLK